MNTDDFMHRIVRDDVRELVRLFRTWELAMKAEDEGADYRISDAIEDRMMNRIERLSIMHPDLPQHTGPDSERAIYTIQEMEGGAWAVAGFGHLLLVEPLIEQKQWRVETITGYHDHYDEELQCMMSEPDRETHFFDHFRAALIFATRFIDQQGPHE